LFNSKLSLSQAQELATKLSSTIAEKNSAENDNEFIIAAFERLLSRTPTIDERQACREFMEKQMKAYETTKNVSKPGLRARESLVRVLMNHNDFVTVH